MRLIDADALKEKAHKEFRYLEITLKDIDGLIKSAPTVEPLRGEWIYCNNYNSTESIYDDCYDVCSACGRESETTHPFCPLCGAKMKGGV
jgi:hypothetical protein